MEQNHFSRHLPSVAIVMVTRNRCDPLLRVLAQVQELDYPREMFDIFLLDGASTDGTVEKVQQQFPKVHIIANKKDVGNVAAENIVITKVLKAKRNHEYIWLLDDDAEIERQTLIPLVEAAERDSSIAVIGSAVYEPNKQDQLITAGLNFDWKKGALVYHIPKPEEIENLFDVEIMPACSSLVRTALYRRLGLWDERFWRFWPDNDWCLRALRNGYRVCCLGKSRVWHRNWAKTEGGFLTPYAVHTAVHGALLFYSRHDPQHSISNIRKYILKCYLKAAFENFILRPNLALAYVEGVQDFIKGSFYHKDYSSWSNDLKLLGIDEICQILSEKILKNPRVILNQIADESQKAEIKKNFSRFFHQITWEEIPYKTITEKRAIGEPLKDSLLYHFPKLILRLLMFYNRKDIIISPLPILNFNIAEAKYTVFIDLSLQGCVCENRIFKGFMDFFTTFMKGLRVAYIDLPRALKKCHTLKEAVADYSNVSQHTNPDKN